jgi:hypothetical protein
VLPRKSVAKWLARVSYMLATLLITFALPLEAQRPSRPPAQHDTKTPVPGVNAFSARLYMLYRSLLAAPDSTRKVVLFRAVSDEANCLIWQSRSEDVMPAYRAATRDPADSARYIEIIASLKSDTIYEARCRRALPPDDTPKPPQYVIAENREAYRIMRTMLHTEHPDSLAHELFDLQMCMNRWYGLERTEELLEAAENAVLRSPADVEKWIQAQSRITENLFIVRPCMRKRPRPARKVP